MKMRTLHIRENTLKRLLFFRRRSSDDERSQEDDEFPESQSLHIRKNTLNRLFSFRRNSESPERDEFSEPQSPHIRKNTLIRLFSFRRNNESTEGQDIPQSPHIRKNTLIRLFSFRRNNESIEGQDIPQSPHIKKHTLIRLFSFRRSNESLVSSESQQTSEEPLKKPVWRCFCYEEIFEATNGFHSDNLVGQGGFAEVYRGVLNEGKVVAVKRLSRAATDEQREKEFLTELGTLGHVCHPNISCLIGCCIDNGLHLIFEFSAHGSVTSQLHDEDSPAMEWRVRHKIAMGVAHGLHYLHKGCQRRIIHRDIKASNVLLTQNFEPQISDFGLAKWLPSQWTHHSVTPIEGTFGYLAPEYFTNGIVGEKTDVFAYGILLLELISGRKPVDETHRNLLSWAKPHLEQGSYAKLADPRLGGEYDDQQLERLALAASFCIRSSEIWRPSMNEVLELLMHGQIQECWMMPTQPEEDELWGFDDLEFDELDCGGDNPLLTPSRASASSFS